MLKRIVPLLLVACFINTLIPAQAATEIFTEDLQAARKHLARGRLRKATLLLSELLLPPEPDDPPEDQVPDAIRAQALVMQGQISRLKGDMRTAETQVDKIFKTRPDYLPALILHGDLHFDQGRYRKARAAYARAADQDDLNTESRFKRGLAAWTIGARREAEETWEAVVSLSRRNKLTKATDLLFLGHCLTRLGHFEEASDRCLEAARLAPHDHRAAVALGNLYFKVYGEVEGYDSGSREFNRVLRPDRGDPGNVPALLGQLRIYLFNPFLDQRKTNQLLQRIYRRDPGLPEALCLEAKLLLGDRRYDEAAKRIKKALHRNPCHLPSLAQLHALYFLKGELKKATACRQEALQIHPGHPGPDTALGLQLNRHYRFPEAIPHLRKAIKSRPNHVVALEALGKALIYCGAGKEAKQVLSRAAQIQDGFINAWRTNAITLQKRMEKEYKVVRRGRFNFHFHPDGSEVLLAFLPGIYEKALDSYSRRYGITPTGPISIEVFHEFGDFSVRTIGFTGFGALGACFGQVITAVSPAAVELKGKFSWGATAWHELAHTVTLELSRRRIPRWLTEGISVYEEMTFHPNQERHCEDELVSDLYNDGLPQVMKFDTWFRGPRVVYAYYLAGLAVRMLLAEKDFPALVKLCKAYGKGMNTDAALRHAHGISAKTFDRKFRSWLDKHVANLALRPRPGEKRLDSLKARLLLEPGDRKARLEMAWANFFSGRPTDAGAAVGQLLEKTPGDPAAELLRGRLAFAMRNLELAEKCLQCAFEGGQDDFHARLEMAQIKLSKNQQAAALAQYAAAHKAWPTCTNPELSPLLARAEIYQKQKRPEQRTRELERYIQIDGDARAPLIVLAGIKGKKGDWKNQADLLQQAMHIDPFDSQALADYGMALQALEKREDALRIFAAALAVPEELDANRTERAKDEKAFRAMLLANRASLLLDLGRKVQAAGQARLAMEEAPDSPGGRRARAILKKCK